MAFKDSFHEVVPGYRVNGDVMVFAIKGIKEGGLCDGCKLLEIGNFEGSVVGCIYRFNSI